MAPLFKSNFSIRSILSEMETDLEHAEQDEQSEQVEVECVPDGQTIPGPSDPDNDSSDLKPPFTYGALIYMAIRSSSEQQLPVQEIYEWISDNFSYYQKNKKSWQNSVRHHLSLSPNFVLLPRPSDNPGKGSYWTIDPSAHDLFIEPDTGALKRNITSNRSSIPFSMGATGQIQWNNGIYVHHYQAPMSFPMPFNHSYAPKAVYFPTPEQMQQFMFQNPYGQINYNNYHVQQQQMLPAPPPRPHHQLHHQFMCAKAT